VVGFALSGLGTSSAGATETINGQSYGLHGYGVLTHGSWRVSGGFGGGALMTHATRSLVPTGLAAKGDANGWFADLGLGVQYRLTQGDVFMVPFAFARYVHTDSGSMSESGAGALDLHYGAVAADVGAVGGGARLGTNIAVRFGTLIPWLRVGLTGYLGGQGASVIETLGPYSAIETARSAPDATVDTAIGVNLVGHGPWRASLAWNGHFSTGVPYQEVELGMRYRW